MALGCHWHMPERKLVSTIFGNFDVSDFWDNSDYAQGEYVGRPLTEEMLAAVEKELGYKLPSAYVELLRNQNGGTPKATRHRTQQPTSWAEDHVAITGIYGVDPEKRSSVCGEFGSHFWMEEWGYPPIGVYFADCPSAGHDMLCLDYRECGPKGEPSVVHVDQESDYRITFVAKNFEQFIRNLESKWTFDD